MAVRPDCRYWAASVHTQSAVACDLWLCSDRLLVVAGGPSGSFLRMTADDFSAGKTGLGHWQNTGPEPEPPPPPLEPEPEPELEGEAEPERGHLLFEREAATEEVSSSRRPPVDWNAHQRSLQEALAAAGLEPPPLTEEDDDGDDAEEAGGDQQPCADEGAGLEGGEADTEAEACRWSSAMEELQELAKTLDAAALRAEVERLRDDHSDVSK